MNYGSICSGIESASVAWKPLGWKCQFLSEIDAFPRAVLQHHYPDVPLHGDFTTIQKGDYGAISLLVGGTPCQSFSVAGLRKGLDDPRGNLMLGFGALAERLRPQWLVWENVPGVLSNNSGRDFGTFLGMLGQLGYGFAYRVLDAQYVRVESHSRAVPQRRRRVFVVGYLGDWRPAAAVLFERESLCGHPPPRRKAGERTSHNIAPCIGASGRGFERVGDPRGQDAVIEVSSTLMSGSGNPAGHNARSGHCKDSHIVPAVSPALKSRDCKGPSSDGDGDGAPLVCHSLKSRHDGSEDGTGRGTPIIIQDIRDIKSKKGMRQQSYVRTHMAVRRLTPRECERLQGFPDDYTLINYRKKTAADGPRYKALGNSMAVNVMAWIGQRIQKWEYLK